MLLFSFDLYLYPTHPPTKPPKFEYFFAEGEHWSNKCLIPHLSYRFHLSHHHYPEFALILPPPHLFWRCCDANNMHSKMFDMCDVWFSFIFKYILLREHKRLINDWPAMPIMPCDVSQCYYEWYNENMGLVVLEWGLGLVWDARWTNHLLFFM